MIFVTDEAKAEYLQAKTFLHVICGYLEELCYRRDVQIRLVAAEAQALIVELECSKEIKQALCVEVNQKYPRVDSEATAEIVEDDYVCVFITAVEDITTFN